MSKTKQTVAGVSGSIVELQLKDLVRDYALSGRSESDIKRNAKDLAPAMVTGWDKSQPGAYFVGDDGKPHLVQGFTRDAAATLNGHKVGYFVEVPNDPAKLRYRAIVSNMGQPISQYEQGRIYAAMRDGDDPEKAEKGAVILAPMTQDAIAKEVGYTQAHVSKCIAIYESPEAIRDLLLEGKVSPGIVTDSKAFARDKETQKVDEALQLRVLKLAYKKAVDAGKETATSVHFKEAKEEIRPKKLVADTGKTDKPKGKVKPANDEPEDEKEDSGSDMEPLVSGAQSSMDFGSSDEPAPVKPLTKKEATTLHKQLLEILTEAAGMEGVAWTLTPDEADLIVKKFIERGVIIRQTPV